MKSLQAREGVGKRKKMNDRAERKRKERTKEKGESEKRTTKRRKREEDVYKADNQK